MHVFFRPTVLAEVAPSALAGLGPIQARVEVDVPESLPEVQTDPELLVGSLPMIKKVMRPDGEEVRLTPTEWGIVEVLARRQGKLVSQTLLLEQLWGPDYGAETNYLRVFMAHIRRKLESDPTHPRYLITEPGMGDRFDGAEKTRISYPRERLLLPAQ